MHKTASSYHHGDLREALIDAAWELIEEGGADSFAMIDAARTAGVSSAAPYRHFKDKDDLLDAVSERAFARLHELNKSLTEPHKPGTRQRLFAGGFGYLQFMRQNPQLFPIMWTDHSNKAHKDELPARADGFTQLQSEVTLWCEHQGIPASESLEISIKMWAMVHGLASLELHQHLQIFMPDADVEALLCSMANQLLDGIEQSFRADGRSSGSG